MQRNRRLLVLVAALLVTIAPATVLLVQSLDSGQTTDAHEDKLNRPLETAMTPIKQYERLQRAHAEGNSAAVREAAEEMREEMLSRLPPDEREAALNAPRQPDVPADTLAYTPPSMPQETIERCKVSLKEGSDPLCELIVLHDEGGIRSGAFSTSEVDAAVKALHLSARAGESGSG